MSAPYWILLVDDEAMNRDALSRRLVRAGYQVVLADSGARALHLLKTHDVDLVLLDVMMPDVDGLQVLATIRETSSHTDLPVIMVTARDQGGDVVAALQMGANDYVTKPINFPVLLARIQTQLQIRESVVQVPAPVTPSAPLAAVAAPASVGVPAPSAHPALFATPVPRAPVPTPAPLAAPAPVATPAPRAPVVTPAPLAAPAPVTTPAPLGPVAPAKTPAPSGPAAGLEYETLDFKSIPTMPAIEVPPVVPGYELLELLGSGGTGTVYKARHVHMDRLVALKLLNPDRFQRPEELHRFFKEVRALAQMSHPNIVVAYDAGQTSSTHYVAMEYVEGKDLEKLVRERGPLPVDEATQYIRQAADGLQHAHERGYVHRDIKPLNLLVHSTLLTPSVSNKSKYSPSLSGVFRQVGVVKILDLGLALLKQTTTLSAGGNTQDGRVLGTADYMAPEQWKDSHEVDIRADLYSLGCTFYFLLTGRVPFPGTNAMEKMLKHSIEDPIPVEKFRPSLPSSLIAIIRKLLAKRPADRIQTPEQLVNLL